MSTTENGPAVTDRIVVGVDGSESSRAALRWACYLAGVMHCTVEAVAAWQPDNSYGQVGASWAMMPTDWDPAADARREVEDTVAAVCGDAPAVPVQVTVREGGAARILMEVAEDARMLVLGSRGHGGFAGLLIGSVSATCAEHSSCPVFITHGTALPPTA